MQLAEKGEFMDYTAPSMEVIGTASELIQNFAGPLCDGDGVQFSMGSVCSTLEEE